MAAERGGAERRQGARRSVAVPNGEGVASGSATLIAKNLKKSWVCRQSPFARKAGATLDVRGLWHARPLPTASVLDKSRPAAAQKIYRNLKKFKENLQKYLQKKFTEI